MYKTLFYINSIIIVWSVCNQVSCLRASEEPSKGIVAKLKKGCCKELDILVPGTQPVLQNTVGGRYVYKDDYLDHPFYILPSNANKTKVYLFYHKNRWIVNFKLGQVESGPYNTFGLLRYTGEYSCPEDVGNNWQSQSVTSYDREITVQCKKDYQANWKCPKDGLNTRGRSQIGSPNKTNSWEECSAKCAKEMTCELWTWVKSSGGSYARNCAIMSWAQETVNDTNVISGVKTCQGKHETSSSKAVSIGLAVTGGILGFLLIAVVFFFCQKRRKKNKPKVSAYNKAPKDKAPKDKAPKDKAPKDKAPKDNAPKDKAPKDNAPKDNAPDTYQLNSIDEEDVYYDSVKVPNSKSGLGNTNDSVDEEEAYYDTSQAKDAAGDLDFYTTGQDEEETEDLSSGTSAMIYQIP